ncbi:6c81bf3f-1d24-4735-8677-f4a7142642f1 [Thermothielavioides terrestris]|uniref:6c81bf3f-1d24-4735-8677-f4a7142642f1 n=1 Tax=Thermothielavioides terrestris TaxID=2587410 RepID=A0A446BGU7_9PEZI|nr:6c81bf3f-1d24-4735-8677-f4a7142642f1 [Thermothielavioides terrestris]
MSPIDQPLPAGAAGHPIDTTTNTRALDDDQADFSLASEPVAFDEPIFDKFYEMDSQETLAPSPNRVHSNDAIPELPPKSALRSSRMLDGLGLKLGASIKAAELGQATTPHDVYLSSEEDASSEADDFSDYDYDSSVEDPTSPTSRSSHEDTARVVSVVFSGKPSLVNLPTARKRPTSSSSLGTSRTRSSTESSAKPPTAQTVGTPSKDRPATPASIASSQHSQPQLSKDASPNSRRSVFFAEMLKKKKPPFLSIDPYANGSTYALDIPKALDSLEGENLSAKPPRTPTALLKGVTRSLSLVRKRSRPNLSSSAQPAVPRLDTALAASSNRASVQTPATTTQVSDHQQQQQQQQQQRRQQQQEQQQSQEEDGQPQQAWHDPDVPPATPITYNDILKAAKRNTAMSNGAASLPSDVVVPPSPGPAAATATGKRGILSGLAARRRSIKLTGKV